MFKLTRLLKRFLKSIIDSFFFNQIFSQHLIMESSSLEEKNIIKDVRNIFRLKKEVDDTTIKDIRNLFRLKKVIKKI